MSEQDDFTREQWENFNRQLERYVGKMIYFPQETIKRYPRYGELLRDLATNFLMTEVVQHENKSLRKMIEEGSMKPSKVIVDVVWDIEAYEQRKSRINGARDILQKEMRPPDLEKMTPKEIEAYVRDHFDEIAPTMEKLRFWGIRKGECGGLAALCPYTNIILLVEGATENAILPILARKLGLDLETLRLAIIPIRGAYKGRYHLKFWTKIVSDANKQLLILLDRDAKQEAEHLIRNDLIAPQHCFILVKGAIERYYPLDLIVKALEAMFKIKINNEEKAWLANSDDCIKSIMEILKRKNIDLHDMSLKIELGKKVAEFMRIEQIPNEIKVLLNKIRTLEPTPAV